MIVCLCGSTKFQDAYKKATIEESLEGNIVLSVGSIYEDTNVNLSKNDKRGLDDLHKKKIDMSDEIFVLNVKGYIGESTKEDIKYAKESGKFIRYLEDPEWYGDGTEEDIGEVDIDNEELQDFFKAIYKVFDEDKLKIDLIKKLEDIIREKDEKGVHIINMLVKKLTMIAEAQNRNLGLGLSDPAYKTWSYYFNTEEIRAISDYISDATSLLSHDSLWSIE